MTLDSKIFEKDGTQMAVVTITRQTIYRGKPVMPGTVLKVSLNEGRLLTGAKKAIYGGEEDKPAPKKKATKKAAKPADK